ncbi:MAG: AMP-binding protein, partial [Solirubrobacteraceae bacterium]
MLVESWLARAARTRPETIALHGEGGTLSYAELDDVATRAARALSALGVRSGDRVALALPADASFAVALHGAMRLGAVAVPVDLRLTADERAARIAGCAALVDAPLDGELAAGAPLLRTHDLDAPAIVVHTSGTTGAGRPV